MSEKPKRKSLTKKQQAFVREYLVDLNATQAAIRAGYSEKTAYSIGHEILNKPEIALAIQSAVEERAERTEVSQDFVIENLTEVVERCMQRAPVLIRRGRELVQLVDDEDRDVWRFDAQGAVSALNLLGKHMGMFVNRHELTGKDGGPMDVAVTRRVVPASNRIGAYTATNGSNGSNGNGAGHP
jgi:phage terminase small subunit